MNRTVFKNIKTIDGIIVCLLFMPLIAPYFSIFLGQVSFKIVLYLASVVFMLAASITTSLKRSSRDIFWPLLYIYIIMLFVRLMVDYVIPGKGMFLYKTPATIMFFYIFPIAIPSIFFYKSRAFEFNSKNVIWILSTILFICLYLSYTSIMTGDVTKSNDQRYDSGFGIFSIAYGHLGVSLILMSIYLLVIYGLKNYRTIILAIYICIGAMSIIFAGSRGPFISLVVCIAFWYLAAQRKIFKLLITLIIIFICIGLIKDLLYSFNDYLIGNGINTFGRILNYLFQDEGLMSHTSGRDNLYEEGLNLFLDNPIFGNSLFIPGKIYVHNIILEQFMGMGLFGGTIFLVLNIIAIKRSFTLVRNHPEFAIFPILYIQNLIFGCFSLTIISLPCFWLCLLISMNKWGDKRQKTKSFINQLKTNGEINFRNNPNIQRPGQT